MVNIILLIIGLAILAYLLGSIPSAVWIGKGLHGVDVREHGSGNAGATNTFRVLGKRAGIIVMAMDILKGVAAASLVLFLKDYVEKDSFRYVNLQLLFGFLAVVGHLFPVFAQFRGGKGIATLFGMILAIHYPSALFCLGLFLLVLYITRYVSLGSILAAISFPIGLVYVFHEKTPLFIAFAITAAVLVILTHQKNIKKLVAGTENKANILKYRDR
ncbi:MAG: glycerol-3-phosphate 1-O-acyltransferase PlsY [Bacteroidota bacterium]|nr:glycerol-3-phosphate 1-O-acyltransferase PlsY [Bacteroidota bacterium]MDX5431626.1 glycerol-3-phosphate 1-O-acyltransferase PlsY [Bacteroidota bacterium]MDX5470344.1 glycerol-3-phosphate 1-O-acyltransferase PlsY [Bacteroidota bacterium]